MRRPVTTIASEQTPSDWRMSNSCVHTHGTSPPENSYPSECGTRSSEYEISRLSSCAQPSANMTTKMQSSRDPYPFPKLQNDQDFYGQDSKMQFPYDEPTHIAQRQNPWNRLNTKCTLASSRREIYHNDPQAPRDSLDFILKSQYDHHQEFLRAKNETLNQPETFTDEHGRILKNRKKEIIVPPPLLGHPLEITAMKKRESIHSIKNAIESHHTQTTNRGYSRKPDGGFFSS